MPVPTYHLKATPRRLPLSTSTVPILQTRLRTTMETAFARSTIQRHTYLETTLARFLQQTQQMLSEEAILLCLQWIAATAAPTTLLTYSRTMAALFPTMMGRRMHVYQQALKKAGGTKPTNQVDPLTKAEFYQWLLLLPPQHQPGVWLAWKTASRWDDIAQLVREDVTVDSAKGCVIDFADKTKMSVTQPFRPDILVYVEDSSPHMRRFQQHVQSLQPLQRITTLTTENIRHILQQQYPRKRMGAHSIKRGAVQYLMEMAALGTIPPYLVAQLAKHQNSMVPLQQTTVRYVSNRTLTARALRSQEATRLL